MAALDLKYYMMDWDDNILFMPTKIHLTHHGEAVSVTTKEFATVRTDPAYVVGDPDVAFREFRDGTGDFVADVRAALAAGATAPSFPAFKRALLEARLFCIVTARGHAPETLRSGIEVFIAEGLTAAERAEMTRNIQAYNRLAGLDVADDVCLDDYLALNGYVGVSSPEFLKAYQGSGGAAAPEQAKTFAVHRFVERAVDLADRLPGPRRIAIGFSDDDRGNLEAMREYIEATLAEAFEQVRFFVYDTSGTRPEVEAL